MPKIYEVHVKFPSGFEHNVNIMPGSPLVFPNREQGAVDAKPRAINSMELAIEYAKGAFYNVVSPIEVEWPSEVTAVGERNADATDQLAAQSVVKRLAGDPGKPEKAAAAV